MTYVLIILFWATGSNGVSVTTQEFSSLDTCQEAKQILLNHKPKYTSFNYIKSYCVKK